MYNILQLCWKHIIKHGLKVGKTGESPVKKLLQFSGKRHDSLYMDGGSEEGEKWTDSRAHEAE